ncbi:hypothetical protein [Aquibium sp. ELW1220]|uniref:hypothetical protein n=1 Tax=Aquibium sp. ELW1220 TaxID=2976766 RepID=UPI0025AF1314|nr:hypothetical protein [Aquibium sp. ELW1220]MDN2582720.1 hypothetical protein [Aquibium sp. ELW1220]
MKTILTAAALVAGLNGTAWANGKVDHPIDQVDHRIDRAASSIDQIDQVDLSIDKAAARILAGRIGDLRGGFAPGVEPSFVRFVSAETTASTARAAPVRRGWIDGLARARDPLAGRAAIGL